MNFLARFLLKKLLHLFLLLLTVSLLTFILVSLSPIDPIEAYVSAAERLYLTPDQRESIAQHWGLDRPMFARFFLWLGQLLQGNLGESMTYHQSVSAAIAERFQASLMLMAMAWLLSGVFGVFLGILAGAKEGSLLDQTIRLYAYTLASAPTFWIALVLLILFSVMLQVTPTCCATPPGVLLKDVTIWQRFHHLLLPALALSLIGVASIALHTREKLIEILHSNYAVFAYAQGETKTGVILHHGLRNIALPAITLQFASLSELFGGSVLAENVFGYPGLGDATTQAALRSDVPLLVGIVFFSAIFVFVGNTIADLSYQIVDPRIRIERFTR
ncbi:MAG: Dipeptide transport system permease protein DppB [Chroococcidiopsis sp. SAG 2025]|uniref:ABC transporter permease n=1 Tax=Chroococcidiopsis sp. SAG 2025 TaxID=171389 RepID=UPI0029371E7E|nr:ABC transporter permease [Chroococcidiopsis sp. SAG 2025]MDV2994828.1 Dipeptide transport system permease protein DppB [Chroococcidiopsis sp. SAG 2025]